MRRLPRACDIRRARGESANVSGRTPHRPGRKEEVDASTVSFTGVAVSPGVAEGPARVIGASGRDTVRPGEILVAPSTDPGWAPYFLNAAGIVMDIGGVMSHGSIIAREYGIPCVVNVGPATKIIKTGQMLRVDGGRGKVTIQRG